MYLVFINTKPAKGQPSPRDLLTLTMLKSLDLDILSGFIVNGYSLNDIRNAGNTLLRAGIERKLE